MLKAHSVKSHRALLVAFLGAAGLASLLRWAAEGSAWLSVLVDYGTAPVGQVFLRLLFMTVVPLLFSAVVMAIADLDLKSLGTMGRRTFSYTVVVSSIAVLIGMGLVNWVRPGDGLDPHLRDVARTAAASSGLPKVPETTAVTLLVQMVPDNPVKAAANGDSLGLIVFSVLFGIALSVTKSEGVERLKGAISGLYDVSMALISGVLKLAPIGIFALVFTMVSRLGLELLRPLLAYVFVVLAGLGLHLFVVFGASVYWLGGRNPLGFFRDVRLAMATAFATASSSATLPTALKVAEENLKLPRPVARFVLTAGSAMNQNGTALFEGVTVLFLAQLFAVDLSLSQQAMVMVISVLGGIGTAGVPAGSLPVIAMILATVGVPPEALGLIMGFDRLLDMCRTTVNVVGDLAAAVYVARGQPSA